MHPAVPLALPPPCTDAVDKLAFELSVDESDFDDADDDFDDDDDDEADLLSLELHAAPKSNTHATNTAPTTRPRRIPLPPARSSG
jgi:hypothetical protein